MSTPMGEIVKNLMDEVLNLVFSRVVWVVEQKNVQKHVRDDFFLVTC